MAQQQPRQSKIRIWGSADKSVTTARTKQRAFEDAQKLYDGVVGLDQWGNVVFKSYEAGRVAKIKLLEKKHGGKTVEEMLLSYSTADYTGSTHHRAQADFIYREGDRQGLNLRSKTIGEMSNAELAALADGIKGFEGWRVGTTTVVLPHVARSSLVEPADVLQSNLPAVDQQRVATRKSSGLAEGAGMRHGARGNDVQALQESLQRLGYCGVGGRTLALDGDFGTNTLHAINSFQHAHHLHVDGIVGNKTLAALDDAKRWPLLSEATHPQHRLCTQIEQGIRKLPHHAHGSERELENSAVALTIAAHASGLHQIDHVVLGTSGINLFAVQGRMDDPGHRRVHVELSHAMAHAVDHRAMSTSQPAPAHVLAAAQQPTHGRAMMGP